MDMIFRAARNAAEGLAHADRHRVDASEQHGRILRAAVITADQVGCDGEDVAEADRLLDALDRDIAARREQMGRNTRLVIERMEDNGIDVRGLDPRVTTADLTRSLSRAVRRIDEAMERGATLTGRSGINQTREVRSGPALTDDTLTAGDWRWLLAEITATSDVDGLTVLAGEQIVRFDIRERM